MFKAFKTLSLFGIVFMMQISYITKNKLNYFIVWNSGYGQWATWIHDNECIHYGIGGEDFRFNSLFLQTCLRNKNKIRLTHLDRFHLSFSYYMKKFFTPLCTNLYQLRYHESAISPHPYCDIKFQSQICLPFGAYLAGHANKNLSYPLKTSCQRIAILPGHGSYKYYKKNTAKNWKQIQMLITSTKYRSHSEDLKTKKAFKKIGRKLIYTHKWGHLIFQVPESF